MALVGRKRISESNGVAARARGNGSAHRGNSLLRESFRPLRLRGRRELVTAMVDALNDILRSERLGF
jgi:hypothetical protein